MRWPSRIATQTEPMDMGLVTPLREDVGEASPTACMEFPAVSTAGLWTWASIRGDDLVVFAVVDDFAADDSPAAVGTVEPYFSETE